MANAEAEAETRVALSMANAKIGVKAKFKVKAKANTAVKNSTEGISLWLNLRPRQKLSGWCTLLRCASAM